MGVTGALDEKIAPMATKGRYVVPLEVSGKF